MSSSWMNKHVLKFSDAKNKKNESFLLAWIYHSDWSLWNNRFAQYFYFARSHVNNTFYFGVDPIDLNCVACLLVCKYTNQKKVDLCTNSDWSFICSNSGKKYCILIGRFDATFFQSLTRLYCISALISEATILLNWLES